MQLGGADVFLDCYAARSKLLRYSSGLFALSDILILFHISHTETYSYPDACGICGACDAIYAVNCTWTTHAVNTEIIKHPLNKTGTGGSFTIFSKNCRLLPENTEEGMLLDFPSFHDFLKNFFSEEALIIRHEYLNLHPALKGMSSDCDKVIPKWDRENVIP